MTNRSCHAQNHVLFWTITASNIIIFVCLTHLHALIWLLFPLQSQNHSYKCSATHCLHSKSAASLQHSLLCPTLVRKQQSTTHAKLHAKHRQHVLHTEVKTKKSCDLVLFEAPIHKAPIHKGPIHFQTQSEDPIGCYRKPVEHVNEIAQYVISLVSCGSLDRVQKWIWASSYFWHRSLAINSAHPNYLTTEA